jgi:hypothetical protein
MDKDFKEILSTSPLKYRVKMDLYGSPSKKEPKEDPKSILKSTHTPNKKSQMQSSRSASQLGSPKNNQKSVMVS